MRGVLFSHFGESIGHANVVASELKDRMRSNDGEFDLVKKKFNAFAHIRMIVGLRNEIVVALSLYLLPRIEVTYTLVLLQSIWLFVSEVY